jgi:endonuclease YncB( thermonuclease family)
MIRPVELAFAPMLRRALPALILIAVTAVVAGVALRSYDDPQPAATQSAVPADSSELVLVGTVTRIVDGDTIDVLLDSGTIRVRLDSIDAPERRQPWGAEATRELELQTAQRDVELSVTDQDRYDRLVATVYVAGENVNASLVRNGHAWAYRAYLNDDLLVVLEDEARREKRGLWSLPGAVAPWEWRRGERQPSEEFDDRDEFEAPGPDADRPTFQCGTKRVCGDMSSCDEAKYFLTTCGMSRLDGNGDGVPCEALCSTR